MSTAVHAYPGLINATNQPRPQLRRAVYIHVSDLTTSAYNIDHARLEEQLARVVSHRSKSGSADAERHGVPTELDTSGFSQKRLQPPRSGYNLCVLVGKVEVVVDKNRVDGSRVRLAEVEVGDETGTVSLRARDEQIDTLLQVSDRSGAVVLRNCTLELFQGKHIRLAITKWGKLCTYPDQVASTPPPPSKMNQDRNFSLIDLSLVAEMYPSSEADTNSVASPNRSQNYGHASPSVRGAGRGGRRNSRGKPSPPPPPQNMPAHFAGGPMGSPMRTVPYQAGYGAPPYESMDAPPTAYTYSTRGQQEQTHHQMAFQQQYEMQQRQMQHIGYHAPLDTHQRPAVSPMLAAASSFDSSVAVPPPPQPQQSQKQESMPRPGNDLPTAGQVPGRSDSPGKMNPQAATFDPRYQSRNPRKPHG